MPASPYVALQYQGLDPSALQALEGKALGNPVEVIESALASYRLLVVNHVKTEVGKKGMTTAGELLRILDLASSLYLRRFTALVGPAAVHSYVKAYQAANAGDVPLPVIYALAEQHAERMGEYFNETSKESLAQGFTKLVNQKVPARIATDRVLDAYGLTPRQMSGFVALRPEEKVYNATPRSIKARMLEYVGRSLRSRFKIFATQEVHNLEQQAQQTAWLWMQQKDLIQPNAEKVWITAKDERVCAQCGPMHGRRVAVGDQFELPNSTRLWVPGAHVNCRCEVKMVEPRLALVQKDLEGKDLLEFNEEHPRGAKGRFSAKARTKPVADAPSAALEEMIARAEALRLQPAFTEVKPLEVKSRGLQPLNRPRSGPLEAAGPPLEVPTAPLEVAGAALQPTVRAGGLEAQLQGLELSLKRQGLEAKRKRQHLEALRPVLPAVAPEPEQLGRIGIFELPEPVYHVLDPSHVDLNSVHYQFHSDTFAAGEIEAVHEADKIRSRIMSDKYNRLTNFGDSSEVVVSHYDPLQGSHFKMRLSADDVDKVITRMAWEDAGEDFPDDPIRVEFENSDGDYMGSKTLSVHDVAADLEIFPGDFSVHVAKLTHAHENISQQHSGTKRFQESWDITGQFEAAAEGSGRGMLSGENMPVKIFTLNPYDPDVGMLYTDPSQLPHVSNTGDDEDWYGETTESWEDDDDWNP